MSIIKTDETAIMQTYGRFPLTLTTGNGSYVWDDQENSYLDFTAGIATCNLGHAPEGVKTAVQEQMDQLWHCSNLYHIPMQEEAAKVLTENSHLDQAFFCNSGAEANEAAWKLARKYMFDAHKKEKTAIVSFSSSFHGRTGGAMAATAQKKVHHGFGPLMPDFIHLPFNEMESLGHLDKDRTAAVLLELVQGEGGVIPADYLWVQALAEECKQKDILLMIDEIQTGAGRTGTFYLHEQYDIVPDIVTVAKGIGSGFPVGAMLAGKKIASSFNPGSHGSTFGGNPLAMAAVKATAEHIKNKTFLAEVVEKSSRFLGKLNHIVSDEVVEIRGAGFLLGIEFKEPVLPLIEALRAKNVLALPAGPNVLRVLPPLTASFEELDIFTEKLQEVLTERSADTK